MAYSYGWPFRAFIKFDSNAWTSHPDVHDYMAYSSNLSYFSIATDLLVALATISFVWYVCEWLIRRAARKGA